MMQELHEAPNPARNRIIAALGVFDGVHLGHRRVLTRAVAMGACHVVTFAADSMPKKQGRPVHYIYHDEQKRRLLTTCGADAVFALPFGEIQELDGESYCKQILKERLSVDAVAVGADFRFGRKASCGAADLQRFGRKYGFETVIVPQIRDEGGLPVSSSHIRFLLESGQITRANMLLGADYQILAHVTGGLHLAGPELGFPTANQLFEPWQCIPRMGVYASFAEINDIWVPAITNIGVRPTVTGGNAEPLAETHLIGWSGELSGSLLPVTLCKFIRAERRFPSLDALSVQIQRDIHARMRLLPAEGNAAVTDSQFF
ncbi:MAG: riboflavin biosynthesis protein RibF [Oscillospiraceae bacterium]|nr:riboflavin biosynthesis protein RibF [Oscillospiraceae bacterium]